MLRIEEPNQAGTQVELNSDVALMAANAFVAHLRKNPAAAERPAKELATSFGLDESFVAQVLQGIHANRRAEVRTASTRPGLGRGMVSVARATWIRLTCKPVLFVIVSSLIAYVLTFGATRLTTSQLPGASSTTLDWVRGLSVLGIALVTSALHMMVYFSHRKSRYALLGAGFLFATWLAWLALAVLRNGVHSTGVANSFVLFLIGGMLLLFLALFYAGLGSFASVLGAWARIKLQDRAEETMSRQDLLERYFELQGRLQNSARPGAFSQEPALFARPAVAWYRRNQFLPNLVVGFMFSTVELLCVQAAGISPGQTDIGNHVTVWFFLLMFVSIGSILFRVVQGYVSKSVWHAALGAVCLHVGSVLAKVLLFGPLTVQPAGPTAYALSEVFDALFMVGLSCGGYFGALVQKRAVRDANLQQNDQATVLAEMVRIQWKLSNEAAAVCVLVVDAAKSSEMKAAADPLSVEYSFREYQEWIAEICAARGGRIHSTAGDGAVVTFTSCEDAVAAARRIQSDIFEFNKNVNRLAFPFRLRIGLHTGEVAGDINEVQFTEVIDIAAHIESACPVGGVAVTDDVALRLPNEEFVDLATLVDGHQVLLLVNPMEDQ